MEKNVSFQIDNTILNGKLIYGNGGKNDIKCTLFKANSAVLQNLFENRSIFKICGTWDNTREFTALKCDVRDGIINFFQYLFIDKKSELPYKIDIGKLYLNTSDVNDEMSVKKIDVKFSPIDQWIPNDENKKFFIKENDCYITLSNNFITIESSLVVTLKQLDQILFNLQVFFEVLVLNNEVKSIKKYIYTVDDTQIEEVMRYKSEEPTKKEFLFRYDTNRIEDILNRWFEAKNTYGKIFDYLSGILNESSAEYLELKFLMFAQWIEAYSGEKFKGQKKQFEKEERNIKENIKQIIGKIENDEDKKLVQQYCKFNNEDTFTKKVKFLFINGILNDIFDFSNHEEKLDIFINDIKKYRNHLTHINIKDDLNNTQMLNLYEILKDMIYILLMSELKVTVEEKHITEIKRKYIKYTNLQASIQKCNDK